MKIFLIVVVFVMLALSSSGVARGQAIIYKPYDPAAPAATVGGSIRGAENDLALTIIAPQGMAATVSASPTLYWHLSESTDLPIELVLIEDGGETPLVERLLSEPMAAGVHAFTVPADVVLKTAQIYQFSAAAVADADIRSNDVFASTLLTRADTTVASTGQDSLAKAKAFAAVGAWYDAVHLLQLSDAPEAKNLWEAMLKQAGLVLVDN